MSFRRFSLRMGRRALVAGAAMLAALVVCVAPAQAATFTVTTLDDSGPGSLRQGILDANAAGGADTIAFAVTGTITLTSGQLGVTDHLTIDGPGAVSLIVSGNDTSRVLSVGPGVTFHVEGVTIADGFADADNGGGIHSHGTTTVSDSSFTGNTATGDYGGGIANSVTSTMTVTDSSFTGNFAGSRGGGINNLGTLTVARSTFTGNSIGGGGGGGINNNGVIAIVDSTFTGNSSGFGAGGGFDNCSETATVANSTFSGNSGVAGGGIVNNCGSLSVTNSTLSGNGAGFFGGGGIYNGGTLTVTNSTLSGNSAGDLGGGGIRNASGTVTLRNTIVANSLSGGNCSEPMIDGGGNLSWPDSTCPGLNEDPLLGPLADNGGATQTMALPAGSAAIDVAVAADCPAADQRGVQRPQGAGCDSGAFEAPPSTPEALVELALVDVQALVDDNPGTPLADKAEDARDKLVAALAELGKTPPDDAAALGDLEGAAGDLEAAVAGGLLSVTQGEELMDPLAAAARIVAAEAIDAAAGGDPVKIAEAEQSLAEGDAMRAAGQFKSAIGKYKEAFTKAEGA